MINTRAPDGANKIQKKGFRHVEEYCLMCARGMSYNMDPPGRHWLDLDIQHSWHRKSSSTSKNVFQPTFLFWADQLSELRACSVTDKQSDFSLVKSFVGKTKDVRERACLGGKTIRRPWVELPLHIRVDLSRLKQRSTWAGTICCWSWSDLIRFGYCYLIMIRRMDEATCW